MFHVKTTASLTTKPIYFPLESWEGATTNNETAGFRCLRKKLPAEQLLVEGFEVPLWHFTERHFRNPGMFVGMFVYCASGTCSFYVFFWLEQQLCCHKHVFCFASWWCFMFYICTSLKRQICRCIHVLDVCFCFSLFWTGMVVFISRDGWFKNLSILKSLLATAKKNTNYTPDV